MWSVKPAAAVAPHQHIDAIYRGTIHVNSRHCDQTQELADMNLLFIFAIVIILHFSWKSVLLGLYSNDSRARRHVAVGPFLQMYKHQCGRHISRTLQGILLQLSINIHSDSIMNRFRYGGYKSKVRVSAKVQSLQWLVLIRRIQVQNPVLLMFFIVFVGFDIFLDCSEVTIISQYIFYVQWWKNTQSRISLQHRADRLALHH